MNNNQKVLSEITIFNKYARFLPELQRRESWDEIINRYEDMMIEKYPDLKEQIKNNLTYVREKKVLPSMRALQFAGKPIQKNNTRIYNCCYLPVDDVLAFSETMFLLLSGTGVGYSVQFEHVNKLPEIRKPLKSKKFLVGDSLEGWADAVKALIKSYFGDSTYCPRFDFSDIRPKGARLITSGGKAPGPESLKDCLHNIKKILDRKQEGDKLSTLDCHDIQCYIADAVLAGGIRRSAMISLFSFDDEDMLTCKFGDWYIDNPQRGRANNSVVALRHRITKEDFMSLWKKIELSNAGEPGIYFTNDKEYGTNPCAEISLRPFQFCNLCEINVSDIDSQEELLNRSLVGAFLGTLQAGFTDFHYLRPIWQKTTEKEALIGVGMTGIASGKILNLDLSKAAEVIKTENERVSSLIGINKAARCTTIKPSGTTSLVLGCSSGIHAWHNDYYIRRMRIGKNEALYTYLSIYHPELVEDDYFKPGIQAIISIPQKAPEGSILRTESALDLLERVKKFNLEYVKKGHRKGPNTNNVSATISIDKNRRYIPGAGFTNNKYVDKFKIYYGEKQEHIISFDEWELVGKWMWENKETFNGLSVLPYDNGSYVQAPFEDISREKFEELNQKLHNIDLSKVIEINDDTSFTDQAACAGNNCEII